MSDARMTDFVIIMTLIDCYEFAIEVKTLARAGDRSGGRRKGAEVIR
jgi:hypothetical protein